LLSCLSTQPAIFSQILAASWRRGFKEFEKLSKGKEQEMSLLHST
jgi:hypothetical protein